MKGYFRKRGTKWSFTIDVGRDPETGKRKQKTVSGFKTKKEAEKACAEMIAQVENGQYVVESKETYGEYLLNYMNNVARHAMRPSGFTNQMYKVKKHILPALGQMKLKDIKPMHIQKFYSQKLNEGFSPASIHSYHAIISKSLRQAKNWGLIQENAASSVSLPRIQKKQLKTWSLDEINQFLHAISKRDKRYEPFYIIYVLAIYSGMRKGEILAIQWKDCDLENGYIRVQRTLAKTPGKLFFQEPKTAQSIRTIKLPDFALQALKAQKIKQKAWRLQLGAAYQDLDLVASDFDGGMITPSEVDHDFKRACEHAGVQKIRFHDLRHTHATILLQLGENPKVVSERLGHGNITVTLTTYSHVLPIMQDNLAKNFDDALKNTSKKSI
ncbi:site-specific integrase [Aneurinibacillus thermoaerophilus]|uniref:site-specific integrase n=1 Tax=Aneurinibacillus thermoaerophilus TaxID=143495 RepID=UPI002E225B46|nr:site-specific integrase [Aneurinibacillus thermoaerophilus]